MQQSWVQKNYLKPYDPNKIDNALLEHLRENVLRASALRQ